MNVNELTNVFQNAKGLFMNTFSITPYLVILLLGILFSIFILRTCGEIKTSTMGIFMILAICVGIGFITNMKRLSNSFSNIISVQDIENDPDNLEEKILQQLVLQKKN